MHDLGSASPPFNSQSRPSTRLHVGPGPFRAPTGRTGRAATPLGVLDRVTRGPLALAVGVGVFALAAAAGGRAGVAIAGGYVALFGGYCLLNFWACREAHCALTGPGFTAVGVLGCVAAAWPGGALDWYREGVVADAFLAVIAVGFAYERTIATRTGQRPPC